jgi:hypothetical protein
MLKTFSGHQDFEGRLYYESPKRLSDGGFFKFWFASVSRIMYNLGRSNVRLTVEVDKGAAGPGLGVLLAVCAENPEGLSASVPSPLTIDLVIRGLLRGEAGVKEVEALLATVRPLAESVTLYQHIDEVRLGRGSKVQTHPLGDLIVRLP